MPSFWGLAVRVTATRTVVVITVTRMAAAMTEYGYTVPCQRLMTVERQCACCVPACARRLHPEYWCDDCWRSDLVEASVADCRYFTHTHWFAPFLTSLFTRSDCHVRVLRSCAVHDDPPAARQLGCADGVGATGHSLEGSTSDVLLSVSEYACRSKQISRTSRA